MINSPVSAPIQDLIRGHAELERTERGIRPHRLPAWVRNQFPDPHLLLMESQPSGVRLAFETAAERIELVTHPTRLGYRGADRPRGSIDLVVDSAVLATDELTAGDLIETDLQTGESTFIPGTAHTSSFDLPSGDKSVEIWLPHNESLELVELRADRRLTPGATDKPVWLHHGSSISHGSNAATPTAIWPAVAARRGGVQLHNLGLGGNAQVDQFTARVIRDTPADLISLKFGINVVNLDGMRLRTFTPAVHGFLDTVRDGHPDVPIVLISSLFCGIHEDTPGPGSVDPATIGTDQVTFMATGEQDPVGRLTLKIIREALESIVAHRDDPALHYLDGLQLYGANDAVDHPLPDALHPDTTTHRLIGERFADYAFADGGPFA